MRKSWLSKWAPLSGLISVVLIVLAGSSGSIADYMPEPDRIMAELSSLGGRGYIVLYFGLLSAFFMFFFTASLWNALYEREGDSGWLSAVVLAGGISVGVVLLVSFSVLSAAIERAGTTAGISVEGATTIEDIWGAVMGAALPFSLAVMVGAASLITINTKVFPAWFGWLGILAALISISPIGYVGQVAAMAWIAVISVWLVVRGSPTKQMVSPSTSDSPLPS